MTAQTCPAVLVKVYDGDTLHMDVQTASSEVFHETHWRVGFRYRLARINAPEMSTPAGTLSRDALRVFCAEQPKTGWTVTTARQDPYGRYIAEIVAPNGTNLSDWMVSKGYAVAVKYKLDLQEALHDG